MLNAFVKVAHHNEMKNKKLTCHQKQNVGEPIKIHH
jgi:hypothetical protein